MGVGESTRPDGVGVARPPWRRLGLGVLAVASALALAVLRPFSDWTPSDGYPVAFGAFLNVLPVCMLPTVGLIVLLSPRHPPAFTDDSGADGELTWPWPLVWRNAFLAATLLPTMGVAGQDYANAALVFVLVWVSFGSFMVIRVRRMNAATRRGMPADEEVERLAFRSEWLGMWAPPTCLVVYFAAVGELGSFRKRFGIRSRCWFSRLRLRMPICTGRRETRDGSTGWSPSSGLVRSRSPTSRLQRWSWRWRWCARSPYRSPSSSCGAANSAATGRTRSAGEFVGDSSLVERLSDGAHCG